MLDLLREKLRRVQQDPDVGKEEPGTQPKKYYKGIDKDEKDDRARHFRRKAKMDDDDPKAYEPAPGDKGAKTKPSQHTKKFKKMFGEDAAEMARLKAQHADEMEDLKNRHEREIERLKNNQASEVESQKSEDEAEKEREQQRRSVNENYDGDMALNSLENIVRNANNLKRVVQKDGEYPAWWNSKLTKADDYLDVCHDYLMSEISQMEETVIDENKEALKNKAEKSGMPYGILKQVFDRGVAAWRTGHRPGTNPQQWGLARVNSFVTKSKGTWGGADKDLAAKVRKESINEELQPKDASYLAKQSKDLDKMIERMIKMKGVDRRDMRVAYQAVQKAKFAVDDVIETNSDLVMGEQAPNTADAMKRHKSGKAGFTDIAHLKAKGLIPRADGKKRKSEKYK